MITWCDISKQIDEYNNVCNEKDKIIYKCNELMSRHTTFRIGGSAALYTYCPNVSSLQWLIKLLSDNNKKYFILGNGSNVLFSDEGYDGAVIDMTAMHEIRCEGTSLYCDAGCSLSLVAKAACENHLTGMEFAYGIPGTCGGAVYMNAGAYDGEMLNIVQESTYLDALSGELHTLTAEEHEFSYRHSVYRAHPEWIIISVVLSLQWGETDKISSKMKDYMDKRKNKQPLEFPNAGSVFKRYPGRYTAQMIDEAGLKGYQIGGAQVSEKHAGFIINKNNATSSDVVNLIEHIKKIIAQKYNIQIECEIIQVK